MRYFILQKYNVKFNGDNISKVANKIAKYLFLNNNKKTLVFKFIEITKGSKNKTYKYKASIIDSKLYVKKFLGGTPSFRIGDIVSLYDKQANGYITYTNKHKPYTPFSDYNLKMDYYDVYIGVRYNDNLIAEKDYNKISYWKISDIKKKNDQYLYKFETENKETTNPILIIEKSDNSYYNYSLYFKLLSDHRHELYPKLYYDKFPVKDNTIFFKGNNLKPIEIDIKLKPQPISIKKLRKREETGSRSR